MLRTHKKIAVVLMNLGGPTSQEAVKPFLFNLFKDPCIIPLPLIARYPLAWLISTLRTKKAKTIYAEIGGGSPLNHNTEKQAHALEDALKKDDVDAKCFLCMRYAPPMTEECIKAVRAYSPDQVVLVPLYPQFSTTTTKSSFMEWDRFARQENFSVARRCCYPASHKFVQAVSSIVAEHIKQQKTQSPLRIVFSAHGIPVDCVEKLGDPYEFQVQHTVKCVMEQLNHEASTPFQHTLCYQSRVGPKKWLIPTIDDALHACKNDDVGAVVVPIAFVSDHSETLVELDIQYRDVAQNLGLAHYSRAPSLNDHPLFIDFLKSEVLSVLNNDGFDRICPTQFHGCGHNTCVSFV